MARLTRQTLNVFAGSASNQGTFGSAQAGSPAVSTSPTTVQSLGAWAAGWNDATVSGQKLPTLEEYQGVQFVHSYMDAYIFQEGIPEYDAGTTYFQHSIVKKPNTYQIYGSLIDNNIGNALTVGADWQLLVDLSNVPGVEVAYGLTTNTSNAYSVNTSPAITTLATGQVYSIKFNAANTGAATLNVGASGATAIVDRGGGALVGGEIVANRTYPLVYNGTNFNLLVSIFPESSFGVTTNSSNAYSITTTPNFGILKQGQLLSVNFNAGNTGAATLNANAIGAIALHDAFGSALTSGAIVAGKSHIILYDGSVFQILTPLNTTIVPTNISGFLPSSITGSHTSATFTLSAGICSDSTNAAYINGGSFSWAASNGNAINGTDAASSTLANSTTYHIFVCSGASGTGSFVSASLTPTFPSGYTTFHRRVGSFITDSSGNPVPYIANEAEGGAVECWLVTQLFDMNNLSVTSTASLVAVSLPGGVKMQWLGRILDESASPNQIIVTSPDESDVAPGGLTAVPMFTSGAFSSVIYTPAADGIVTTNTSAQVRVRSSGTSAVYATTRGWKDRRRT